MSLPSLLIVVALDVMLSACEQGTIAELGEGVVEPLLKVGTKVCVYVLLLSSLLQVMRADAPRQ